MIVVNGQPQGTHFAIFLLAFLLSGCAATPPVHVVSAPHPEQAFCDCNGRDFLVHFESGSDRIPAASNQYIADAVAYYFEQPIKPPMIWVYGYEDTAEAHGESNNLALDRAVAVKKQLILDGIPPSKIKIVKQETLFLPEPLDESDPNNRLVSIGLN